MAELMQGWKRTHRVGELTAEHVGQEITLMGWAGTWRNLGALIFIGLRDRSGLMQVVFNESDIAKDVFALAENCNSVGNCHDFV